MKTAGLYIHVPFCVQKCGYCDFYSETALELKNRFLTVLPEEMRLYRGKFCAFDSLYIGGGTPSVLTAAELEKIVENAGHAVDILPESEWTFEANPADLNIGYLQALRSIGFNRVNIGVQSFQDVILTLLGRRHTAQEAKRAIHDARAAGFENIGLDLIYGIPGQTLNEWQQTVSEALTFEPEHVSCYQLTLSDGTPLGKKLRDGDINLPDEESSLQFFLMTSERLEAAGYIHYEVSNYARGMDFASRHNCKYWDHSPYLGLGPGAHSFFENKRWWNHRSVVAYAHDLELGRKPMEGEEVLSFQDLILETFALAMRTKAGLDLGRFSETYGLRLEKEKKDTFDLLEREGLVLLDHGYLKPTLRGMAVADSLALI
jgi:oxygen-independent coproporphyrinogen-3 oxidase